MLPDQVTRNGVEAIEVPHRSDTVRPSLIDGDGSSRSGAIADRVRSFVNVLPNWITRFGIKAQHPFNFSLGVLFSLSVLGASISNVNASLADRRAAVTGANFHLPLAWQALFGQRFDQAPGGDFRVAVAAAPLGPIFSL